MLKKKTHVYSPRMKGRKHRISLIKRVASVVFVLSLFALIVYLGHASFLSVSTVNVLGASVVSVDAVRDVVKGTTEGNSFLIFPKTNTLLFPKEETREKILASFPRLENISLSREGSTAIVIEVKERTPAYMWCVSDGKNCYFVDKTGFIFDTAPEFSANPYFVIKGSVGDAPIGTFAMTEKTVDFISSFLKEIKKVNSFFEAPDYITVKSPDDFSLNFENGFQIFFDTDEAVSLVIENIRLAIERGGIKDKLSDISYIDARFGNKIFFK